MSTGHSPDARRVRASPLFRSLSVCAHTYNSTIIPRPALANVATVHTFTGPPSSAGPMDLVTRIVKCARTHTSSASYATRVQQRVAVISVALSSTAVALIAAQRRAGPGPRPVVGGSSKGVEGDDGHSDTTETAGAVRGRADDGLIDDVCSFYRTRNVVHATVQIAPALLPPKWRDICAKTNLEEEGANLQIGLFR
jgi:hypothetical protein